MAAVRIINISKKSPKKKHQNVICDKQSNNYIKLIFVSKVEIILHGL